MKSFRIPVENWLKYKTFITQEMLKKGFLASNTVYACIEHKEQVIDKYFENLSSIFTIISRCESGEIIDKYLDGPVCHKGFKRLN